MGGVGVKLKKSQRDSSPRVRPHANHLAVRVVVQSESLGFLQCHFEEGGLVIIARDKVTRSDCPVFCVVHNLILKVGAGLLPSAGNPLPPPRGRQAQ